MKKALTLLLALGLAVPAMGQPVDGYERATLIANWDATALTNVYVWAEGQAAVGQSLRSVWNEGLKSGGRIKNSSSVNLEPFTAADSNFMILLAVGDIVRVIANGRVEERVVVDVTFAPTAVEVNSTINLSSAADSRGFAFWTKRPATGAAATDGWFSVRGFRQLSVETVVEDMASTSVITDLYCRVSSNGAAITTGALVDTSTITAANTTAIIPDLTPSLPGFDVNAYDECRVGVRVTVDAAGDQVSVFVLGRR
jgi:hypothetical protein